MSSYVLDNLFNNSPPKSVKIDKCLTKTLAGKFDALITSKIDFGSLGSDSLRMLIKRSCVANNLGIITDDNKQCIAKNSFKINQSINYSEMLKVVKELDLIMQRSANFDINDITKIDKNKNEKLIKELEKLVIDSLWNNRNNLVALDEALDFIHKDFENFLKASKFKFAKTYHENNETLFKTIISKFTDITKDEFEKKLKSFSVVSLDEEETELTKETIYNHLVYEINHLTKSYFLINGTYYEITSNFKNSLNESCKNFITENYDNGLNKAWDNTDTEGVYNLSYKGENSTIVLDTITPENIESCDILKYDDNFVYLYQHLHLTTFL